LGGNAPGRRAKAGTTPKAHRPEDEQGWLRCRVLAHHTGEDREWVRARFRRVHECVLYELRLNPAEG